MTSVARLVCPTHPQRRSSASAFKEILQRIEAIGALLRLQEGEVALEAPAIAMTATELIRNSGVPMEILAWAHSCHVAEYACGSCGGCRKHYETLRELGIDPY